MPIVTVELRVKPLILLGFCGCCQLPKIAISRYNLTYFLAALSCLSRGRLPSLNQRERTHLKPIEYQPIIKLGIVLR
jgi:hypothetical protein